MKLELEADLDDLIWRLAVITAQLHDETGDREALLVERSDLMREAQELGLFESRYFE